MCFRPAGVDLPDPICPECGKKLTVVGGVVMKKCPFCKADLEKYAEEMGYSAPGPAKAPGAPAGGPPRPNVGPPKAPGGPPRPNVGPPKVPGA
jgi:hypothetical protein